MKKVWFAAMCLLPAMALAEKPAPNPADYTLVVQVQSSRLITRCTSGLCNPVEQMDVVIDGKKYELSEGSYRFDLLRTGSYKAKLLKEETTRPYEYMRTYEFLFSDGKTRDYVVTGEISE